MDSKVSTVLDEYHARMEREVAIMRTLTMEEIEVRKNEMLISIGPESAQILSNLIKGQGARTIVELGASYGYSTLWFAEAAQATGGHVISFELVASGAFIAADNILQPLAYREMGEKYRQHVRASGRFDSILLPVGSGIELSGLGDSR